MVLAITFNVAPPPIDSVPADSLVGKSVFDLWHYQDPVLQPTQKLNAAIRDALADADLRDKLAKLNVDPTPSSPVEFEALIKLETKKWADVIKRAKITVD